jgi:hypothetical protein
MKKLFILLLVVGIVARGREAQQQRRGARVRRLIGGERPRTSRVAGAPNGDGGLAAGR